jgi:hypothetical protein
MEHGGAVKGVRTTQCEDAEQEQQRGLHGEHVGNLLELETVAMMMKWRRLQG